MSKLKIIIEDRRVPPDVYRQEDSAPLEVKVDRAIEWLKRRYGGKYDR